MAVSSDGSHPQMQAAVNCDTCENTAEHLCKTCQDRLCDRCKNIHSKSKSSFDHKVVTLTQEAMALSLECPSHHICKWHPEFRAHVGCKKCSVPLCDKCLVEEHNGHTLMGISDLFQHKKDKLEQKLTTVSAELPNYESKLQEIRGRKELVSENKEIVKKEICAYFEKVASNIEKAKRQVLDDVDATSSKDLNKLMVFENTMQNYVQSMKEYISQMKNEDIREKISFIFYATCAIEDTMPPKCPHIAFPGIVKYSEGTVDSILTPKISGFVWNSSESTTLLKKDCVKVVRKLSLHKEKMNEKIDSICFQEINDLHYFWVFASNMAGFTQYDELGKSVRTLEANIQSVKNKPLCITEHGGVIYRKDRSSLFIHEDSQERLYINVAPMLVACICSSRSGGFIAVLVNLNGSNAGIVRLSDTGERLHYITHSLRKWTPQAIFTGNITQAYITENINGDICLSTEGHVDDVVDVISTNGEHRFSYRGAEASVSQPFLSRGICTDIMGNILIADENNHGVHILDKDGNFLALLTIPGAGQVSPISLCVDNNNDLCVGCSDGKIRIIKYLE